MADLNEILNGYKKSERQYGAGQPESIGQLQNYLSENKDTFGLDDSDIEYAQQFSNVNEWVGSFVPPRSDSERILETVSGGYIGLNEDQRKDELIISESLRELGRDDRGVLSGIFRNAPIQVKTANDLILNAQRTRIERGKSFYTEDPVEQEGIISRAIDGISQFASDVSDRAGVSFQQQERADLTSDALKAQREIQEVKNFNKDFRRRTTETGNILNSIVERNAEAERQSNPINDVEQSAQDGANAGGISDESTEQVSRNPFLTRDGDKLPDIGVERSIEKRDEAAQSLAKNLSEITIKQIENSSEENNILDPSKSIFQQLGAALTDLPTVIKIFSRSTAQLIDEGVYPTLLGVGTTLATGNPAAGLSAGSGLATQKAYENGFAEQVTYGIDQLAKEKGVELTGENISQFLEDNKESLQEIYETSDKVGKIRAVTTGGSFVVGGSASTALGKGRTIISTAGKRLGLGATATAIGTAGVIEENEAAGKETQNSDITLSIIGGAFDATATATSLGFAARTSRKFKNTEKTPLSGKDSALNDAADSVTTKETNKYNITPEQLIESGLVKRSENTDSVNLREYIQDESNWVGDLSESRFLEDTAIQDQVFQRVAENNVDKAFKAGVLTDKSTDSEVSAFINASHKNGADATIKYLVDGVDDANVKADLDNATAQAETTIGKDNPKFALIDNETQAEVRRTQRETLRAESEFRKQFETDNPKDVGDAKAEAAYKRSREAFQKKFNPDTYNYQEAYESAAKAYRLDSEFKDRLNGLARTVPVIDDSVTGATGFTNRKLIDTLENPDSFFYQRLEQNEPILAGLIKKSVKDGDLQTTIASIREGAAQNKTYETTLNGIADQLEGNNLNPDSALIAQNLDEVDAGVDPAFYLGERTTNYDGSVSSAIEILNSSHGVILRNAFIGGNKVENLTNNQTVAAQVNNIVTTSSTSSEAVRKLYALDDDNINAVIEPLLNERKNLENNIDSTLFDQLIVEKQGDPKVSTDTGGVNRGLIEESEPNVRSADVEQVIESEGKIRTAYNKAVNGVKTNLSPEGLFRNLSQNRGFKLNGKKFNINPLLDDVNAVSGGAAKVAQDFVKNYEKDSKVKLSKKDNEQLYDYLNGNDVNFRNDKIQVLANAMQDQISTMSEKIEGELQNTIDVLDSVNADLNGERIAVTIKGKIEDRINAIRANMGQYLTGSYEAFADHANWAKDIEGSESRAKAVEILIKDGLEPQEAEAQVRRTIQAVVKSKGDAVDFYARNLNSDDLFKGQNKPTFDQGANSILKKKQNIPPWMKELFNAQSGGREAYVTTILRQNQLYHTIRSDNAQMSIFNDAGVVSPVRLDDYVQITPEAKFFNRFSAFQEVFIPKELYDSLSGFTETKRSVASGWLAGLNTGFKINILLLNPSSYATQAWGMVHYGLIHNLWNPLTIRRSAVQWNKLKQAEESGGLDNVKEIMLKKGILNSASAADLDALFKDNPKGWLTRSIKNLGKVYGSMDVVGKSMLFFKQMNFEEAIVRSEVESGVLPRDTNITELAAERAGDIVADIMPTPNRVVEGVKKVRSGSTVTANTVQLVATPFLTFTSEIPRNIYNTIGLVKNDLASGNPLKRKRAYSMLAGISAYVAAQAIRDSDQDDKYNYLDNQDFIKSYQKGQFLTEGHRDELGNLRYTVSEYTDPWALPKNLLTSAGRLVSQETSPKDFATESTRALAGNFTGGSPLFAGVKFFTDLVDNRKDDNEKLDLLKEVGEIGKKLNPAVSLAFKIYEEEQKVETADRNATIDNLWKKWVRLNENIIDPEEEFENAGFSVFLSSKDLRKSLESLKKDFDPAKSYKEFNDYNQGRLDKIWELAPQLIEKQEDIKQTKYRNPDKLIKSFSSKSGVNSSIVERILAIYETDGIKPSIEEIGLNTIPDVTRFDSFKFGEPSERVRIAQNAKELKEYIEEQKLLEKIND